MATTIQTTTPINGTQLPTPPAGGNPATGIGANSGIAPQLQAWLDQCQQFGEQAGAGAVSLVGWYQDMVQRAYRDEIDPDMAEKGTKEYQDARRRRAAMLGKQASAGEGNADKVRISEARKMIKLGKLAQFRTINNGGLGVFNLALKIVGEDANLKGETAKHLLKVATEQLRKPDAPLDADHIRSVLSPKESADKTEGDHLYAAKKLIELAAGVSSWDADKRAALTSINARIEKIGFKTAKERVAEEKAKEQARKARAEAKKLAKLGTGQTMSAKNALVHQNRKGGQPPAPRT